MADINLTSQNFKQEVLENKGLVVVDFWAPWCGPCGMVGPIIEELAQEYTGKVKIVKLNVDENADVAGQFSVMSLPSILFFKNGQPMKTMVGAQNKENYKQEIDQLISG
jgi:thioredoxin 1